MKGITPQGKPWTWGHKWPIPPQGAGYVSLRPLLNGIPYRSAWEFRLRKTPCSLSFRKGNHHDGSAPLARLRITIHHKYLIYEELCN